MRRALSFSPVLVLILLGSAPAARAQHSEGGGRTNVHQIPAPILLHAVDLAGRMLNDDHAGNGWIGYSVLRSMPSDQYWGWRGPGYLTLADLLDQEAVSPGANPVYAAAKKALEGTRMVRKPVAVLQRRAAGTLAEVRMMTLDSKFDPEGETLIWMGEQGGAESLRLLLSQVAVSKGKVRESLVAAIGMHQEDEVPTFLLGIAEHAVSRSEQEVARYWLAVGIAHRMLPESSLREANDVQRAALYALAEANQGHAARLLQDIIEHADDVAVRRQAILVLAHVQDPDALKVLKHLADGQR